MKLRKKTLIVIGVTLVGLNTVLYAISSTILLGSLTKAEEHNTRQSVESVLNVLTQTEDELSSRFADWSAWDDTYTFIEDANQRYIESNLVPEQLATLKVNLAVFIHSSGRIVFGTGFDLKNKKKIAIPEALQKHLSINDSLVRHDTTNSNLSGILMLPESPMLIISRPILTTKGSEPIRGTVIFGRYLDAEGIKKLAEITRLSLSVYGVNDTQMPPDFQSARESLFQSIPQDSSTQNFTVIRPLNDQTIAGYTLLKDIYGKPALLLRVDVNREIYRQNQSSQTYLMISLLVVGLVFGGVTLLLLERLVLSRLTGLSAGVTNIGDSGDLSQRVLVPGKDELSGLADSINRMLSALDYSQRQYQESEERHRTVIEQASEGIVLIDARNHRILQANTAFRNLLGYTSASLLELTIDNIIVRENENIDGNFHRIPVDKNRYLGELRYRCQDGFLVDVEVSASLISYSGRQVLCSVVRDITERKRSEEKNRLLQTVTHAISEAQDFHSALEVTLIKVCQTTGWNYGEAWIQSYQQNVLEISPVWYSNSNSELEKTAKSKLSEFRRLSEAHTFQLNCGLPGRVWSSQQSEWIRDIAFQSDEVFLRSKSAIANGIKSGFAVPILADNEVLAILVFFMFETKYEDEQLVELISSVASQLGAVMGRKRAEEALRQAEEKYRSIFENSIEGIFQTTTDGRLLSANPALARILDYSSPEEAIAHITNIERQVYVNPNRRAEFIAVMQEHDAVSGFESQVYRQDGSIIWIAENAQTVRDARGTLLYYEGTVEDTTFRKVAAEALRFQQQQSEDLLLNILPEAIAERLKQASGSIADSFAEATVLFADIVGFTQLSAQIPPSELVELLNKIFSAFDHLAERYSLEKIKTIGDAYMVVGGLPMPRDDHAEAIAQMALDMQKAIAQFNTKNGQPFRIRIGINTGPVVAGVIGIKKFIYDLWGDTVNTASRMESQGLPGSIQVTDTTYELLRDKFEFQTRGTIQVKGKGNMTTYLLLSKKVDKILV